jgi:hypothetical protein
LWLPDLPSNRRPLACGWPEIGRARRHRHFAAERACIAAIIVEQHSAGNLEDIGIPMEDENE